MAGKTGRCVTDIGCATHKYWHGSGQYFRQPLDNQTIGAIEFWNGTAWEKAWSASRPLPNAVPSEQMLPNTVLTTQ